VKTKNLIRAAAVASAIFAGLFGGGLAAQAAPATPPSAEDFSRVAALRNVSISPDGKHIAGVVSPDGINGYVSVWATSDLSKAPINIGCGDRNDCVAVQFVKNDRLGITTRQLLQRGSNRDYIFRLIFTDLDGGKQMTTSGSQDIGSGSAASILDMLPMDPKNIVILDRTGGYKLNVYNGQRAKVYTTSDKFFREQTDLKGEIRARQTYGYEDGKFYFAQYIRNPSNDSWEEHFRWFAADREEKQIVGFTADPNVVYVRSNEGRDKSAIFLYDVSARKFLEPAFEVSLFDAGEVIQSASAKDYGRLLGFSYVGASQEEYWTDGQLASLNKGLRKALGIKTEMVSWVDPATGEKSRFAVPQDADVSLNSWSDDFKFAIVVKVGPRQPAEYYLLTDKGQLTLLGKSRPWFDTTLLGETHLIQYQARDGLMIPAFLTTPNKDVYGAGPYPTIVTPHGGPWARDYLGWDGAGWTQYFAARGYAVLQPQYRGSDGWGQKLWRAGDGEWGQKMQDDKDDGVKYLIAQKIAAPDRVAMHGYSYGGYAAMAASVRPNGLYQCAVAGAGVAELDKFRERLNQGWLQEFQRPTIAGLQPLDHADEVSIPIFLYHGELDVTVPIEQSKRFVSALERAGKPVKFLELKKMGHQSSRWEPGQIGEVLRAVDGYLRTECGPGGL
jgi:acetyl esterase/lipase